MRSNPTCYVHFDGLHSVHLCRRVCFAQLIAYLCVRVRLYGMCVSTSRTKYAHCHGRSSLTASLGRGVERCASERQYRRAVCKTKLTIGREREEGGNEVEREDLGAEGERGISARGIREVVISRKQTGCQGGA